MISCPGGVYRGVVALLVVATATACSRQKEPPAPASTAATPAAASAAAEAPIPDTASPYDVLPESVRLAMGKASTDDLDAMVKRRAIRVAVTFSGRGAAKAEIGKRK